MVSSEEWRFQKHTIIATLFAVVAGYADVVSLVRYQAFASILTGWYYVAICASFAMGAFLHRVCELRWPNRGGSIASIPLALLMLTAEVVYIVTDCNFHETYLRWTVVLVAPLFGVIAAACSNGRMGTHTTMVTGHILALMSIAANIVFLRKSIMSVMVIAGTIAGACAGSFALVKVVVHHVLLFPVPFVIYALLWLHDHLAKPRSLIKKAQSKLRQRNGGDDQSVSSRDDEQSLSSCSEDEDDEQV